MNRKNQHADVATNRKKVEQPGAQVALTKTLREQAKTRLELARTRREQARTRTELAKTRREQTKTRVELEKTRKKKNGIPAGQVEKTLQRVVHKEFNMHDLQQKSSASPLKELSLHELASQKSILGRLTNRQREILRLIAESQNTKQIAEILKVSSKTVEYHRSKLMAALNVHDVPGLVRFALRVGLIPPES